MIFNNYNFFLGLIVIKFSLFKSVLSLIIEDSFEVCPSSKCSLLNKIEIPEQTNICTKDILFTYNNNANIGYFTSDGKIVEKSKPIPCENTIKRYKFTFNSYTFIVTKQKKNITIVFTKNDSDHFIISANQNVFEILQNKFFLTIALTIIVIVGMIFCFIKYRIFLEFKQKVLFCLRQITHDTTKHSRVNAPKIVVDLDLKESNNIAEIVPVRIEKVSYNKNIPISEKVPISVNKAPFQENTQPPTYSMHIVNESVQQMNPIDACKTIKAESVTSDQLHKPIDSTLKSDAALSVLTKTFQTYRTAESEQESKALSTTDLERETAHSTIIKASAPKFTETKIDEKMTHSVQFPLTMTPIIFPMQMATPYTLPFSMQATGEVKKLAALSDDTLPGRTEETKKPDDVKCDYCGRLFTPGGPLKSHQISCLKKAMKKALNKF